MKEIKIKESDEIIYTFKTPSKLPVYMWKNDKKKNTYMALVVKYGSIGVNFKCNNVKYNVPSGIAHYLEHLKFHLKDVDVSELFLDLGCESNAYTSFRETVFEVFANENIYDGTKLLLDFVYNDYFSKKMVEDERGIILEEANSKKDNAAYEFYIKFLQNYFLKSNYKYPVIGTEKDIKEITLEDIKLVYNFFYRPENMFLVITGNFDPEKMKKTICENEAKREFKDLGKIEVIEEIENEKLLTDNYEHKSKNCKNTRIKLSLKTNVTSFKGCDKCEIVQALRCMLIAKYGSSSDFYEYVIQNNIATDFYTSVSDDSGVIGIDFNCQTEKPEEMKNIMLDSLKEISINDDELKRIKNFADSQFIMKFDNIYGVAASMINTLVDYGKPDSDSISIIKKLTTKKINDIYKCVNQKNYLYGVLKPSKGKKKEA